jgi:hypothetical protein
LQRGEGNVTDKNSRYPLIKGAFPQYLVQMAILGIAALFYMLVMSGDPEARGPRGMFVLITVGPVVVTVILLVKLRQERLAKAKAPAAKELHTP